VYFDFLLVIDSLTFAELPLIIHSIIVTDPLFVIEDSRERRWKVNEGR
jgi:hypothetical protein